MARKAQSSERFVDSGITYPSNKTMFVLFKERREKENKVGNRSQRRRAIRRHLILFVSYRVGEYSGNLSYGLYANYSWGIMRAVSCYVIPRIIVQRIGDARFVIRQTAPTSTIKVFPLISDLAIKIDCDFLPENARRIFAAFIRDYREK